MISAHQQIKEHLIQAEEHGKMERHHTKEAAKLLKKASKEKMDVKKDDKKEARKMKREKMVDRKDAKKDDKKEMRRKRK